MSSLVETVKKARHHPRLENQWRTVVVHLSTWDIGQKISERDVAMAHQIDALYEAQREGR
jgi:pterin-4a-carbinolamine dehydratase